MSEFQPPSRVGKPNNFFALREQLGTTQRLMPTKNKISTSFAVSEDKVNRKKFSFGESTQTFAQIRNMSALDRRDKYNSAQNRHVNRHASRTGGTSNSIDIVFHTEIKGPRQASDGGIFSIGSGGQSKQATKRLGTAESGHGRQFLITDFQKKIKDPHFQKDFGNNMQKLPTAFAFKKSEFSDINNSSTQTKNVIRPSDHIFNVIRQR